MPGLFAFAGEGDPAGGRVDETADEHSLRGSFAGHVLRDLVVELVGAQHVAAVAIDPATDRYIYIYIHFAYNIEDYSTNVSRMRSPSSTRQTVTLRSLDWSNDLSCKWNCVVTQPTYTWAGSWPGKMRTP